MELTLKHLLFAYKFSATKHSKQRRKGAGDIPYINHPVDVANMLAQTGGTGDLVLLIAAVLHDVLEDTVTSEHEIEYTFGRDVLMVVQEVSDNMNLSKQVRKAMQIEKSASLSDRAKLIKIADKVCNIADMLQTRFLWTRFQKIEYIRWSIKVVENCRGINPQLDTEFDKVVGLAEENLGKIESV